MKTIAAAFANHLLSGETTLCRAWRVTLIDGAVMGFTEHDAPLAFQGTAFEPASGFAATAAETASGLAATGAELRGGFSSEAIREADLAAGRFDGARVELFLVNWQAADEQHLLLTVQEIGDVSRAGAGFSAELRSIAHRLAQPEGRIYNRRCDAELGDNRCRVDMTLANRRLTGTVAEVANADRLVIAGLPVLDVGHFRLGACRFLGGALAGQRLAIEESAATETGSDGNRLTLALWLPMDASPETGDQVMLTVGCDKSFTTCRTHFSNALNFRGFPQMPGSDFAYSYVGGDTTHDGRVLYD
ncbi:DUF2163 domain-containing protein [Peteryoungia ipomoeae]|uniref:DUF2163 domain-containing protein n=1 Tax=Peteryoungia ipomoeae TaxID=1210932 RepID=A0A4S8P827_9HYPH|nr:DUF2163 domain-containing protein [Peteryoungia ipomoeae]THV25811.1 DUF2163 domain-containing protein [Peteryoungia ipomoeae]